MSDDTERESAHDALVKASAEAFRADPAYSIPEKRLAGSAACLNCGTPLEGPFCHHCGQPDRNFLRFFPAMLRELMSDLLDFDSRFARTMKPLLFKPGRLTRDYLDGRRFRYTPPLRLYLFSSIAFFVLAAFLSSGAISTSVGDTRDRGLVQIGVDTEEELAQVEEQLSSLPPAVRGQIDLALNSEIEERRNQPWESDEININGEPWDLETNPVEITWLPGSVNDWINEEIGASPEKAQAIGENPNLIVDSVFDVLPGTMFVLLPVVALILKFWYAFASRYYIEHLILALHNHAFLFVVLIFALLLEVAEDWFTANEVSAGVTGTLALNWAIGIWIPVYLVWALRTVYRQNWVLTLGKGVLIGISYVTLLGIVSSVVALLAFVLI